MRKRLGAATLGILLGFSIAVSAQPTARMVETLTLSEFLQLHEDDQAVYVGGLIEGMAFAYYNYDIPDYPRWASCVTKLPVGDAAQAAVAFIKANPTFKESIASALTLAIAKRCGH